MLFSQLLVAGGTLYVGVKRYKEHKKRKETPCTFYAERMKENKKPKTASSLYSEVEAALEKFKEDKITPFVVRLREAAIQSQSNEIEKKANRDLAISLTSLSLATGGILYPPLALLSWPGFLYITWPIYKKTYELLFFEGKVNVDTLVTITVAGCIANNYIVICNFSGFTYSLSRKLLLKVKDTSKNSLINVFRQQPRFVWVQNDGIEVEIPFEKLKVGDTIVVHAGEIIPADGYITDGYASIDQHLLTGEFQPAEKGIGDYCFTSTVLLSGRICLKVEKAGEETTVAKIGQILNQTVDFKTTMQLRAEVMADKTALPTLIVSGLSLPILGPMGALAILNSHFGYRMTIVSPIGILTYLNLISKNGILIKDGRTLDLLNKVDTMVFDKTGTLTEEQPHVGSIHTCASLQENEILKYAAAAEYKQTHPIARAIQNESRARKLKVPEIDEAEYKVGYGLTVTIDNQLVRVGSQRFMEISGITIPPQITKVQNFCHHQGHSLVMVALNNKLVGAIELHATVRPEAKKIISDFREGNIKQMYIISGDHEMPTKRLAGELGIDHYFAETLPQNKAKIIQELQEQGKSVCYVGDGINDSIALKKAHVSISLRGASSVATDTAQIILMDGSLNQLPKLFDLAQDFDYNMKVSFMTLMLPTLIGISGAFFLHFGLVHSIILNQIGLFAGLSNSSWPLLQNKKRSDKQKVSSQKIDDHTPPSDLHAPNRR
jgi:Cu2+-exporting ATPase